MLIGIDASRANRSLRTGTEWYSFYIISHLAAIDRENEYVLYLDKEPVADLAAAVSLYSNVRFKILKWPWRYFWTIGRLSLEMIKNRPDVLFVPAHSLPLIHPRRTVNTVHDIAFIRENRVYQKRDISTKSGRLSIIDLLVRIFTRGKYQSNSLDHLSWSTAYSVRNASRIIAVSEFTKNEILDVYGEHVASKTQVVYNGYPEDLYYERRDPRERNTVLEKYGIEEPFFLYVGRLEKKKNTAALVESFSLYKEAYPESEVRLVLIGNAGYGYDEVKYIIEEYNLSRWVLIPGWVNEDDLPVIFSAALAFVFPTLHEGFGIPALQAMAAGTPALLSDLPVLHEVAGEAALYFDPRDRASLASALAYIASNENLRATLTEQGLDRCRLFSWEKSARETLSVLTS
ncbi:MAG: glycosyltransferase family 1 protein [bacterium]|nr:glycosyltransferase family 1 protein [bacterium]